ncbi:glycosyltransferase [Sediminibacillus dalangtanensis]|uniref:Glycosyltransferase n=1 Tax=Sediminibacillus dalangtanensis TaxID=2729421 RepID=A0ABX7VXL3_9BACI|nr:glycosyltransferase [Sediminibacillus dalangtanensis]QTN00780.1 glycosyltransferase [Sediminibacillus dalangtanensis]
MDQQSIEKRLKTINKLKLKLEETIAKDLEVLNSSEKNTSSLVSKPVDNSSGKKMSDEEKRKYLKFRDENADENFLGRIQPMLDEIPVSNGSRYYNKMNVTIGIVADEFLFNSFQGVANFIYITPDNYKDYADQLDVFLLVTTWKGLNMEWKGLGNPNIRKHRKKVFDILKFYKDKGIKTVFYSKEDPVNYDIFIELAQKCEYVFTTAEEVVDRYKKDCGNENVSTLTFGVNPSYHNPVGFKKFKQNEVLFSGSWYVKYPHRIIDTERIFDGVIENGTDLKIVDRNYQLKLDRHFFPKKYVKYVSPAVDHNTLQKLHKLYDWAINLNSVKESKTMFANRIYELQALGNILLSNYSVGVNDKFPNIFLIHSKDEVKDILNSFSEEEIYRHQITGIRRVMSWETTFHRIQEVLEKTNTPVERVQKTVGIVVKHISDRLNKMIERQTYPYLEVVLEKEFDESKKSSLDMITFFDEEYEYGEFYIEDMVNAFKYTDCDYITKDAYYRGNQLIPGVEHDYVSVMKDKARTLFWSKDFTAKELLDLHAPVDYQNGYSIDRFEFNNQTIRKVNEEKDYKLSVIVPVYNNGDYLLNKCFNSLKRSSMFNDMELIMVDDGSTDNYTPKVIESLSRRYPNIKTYYFEEGGSGSASRPRNKGAQLATAPYLTYLDPDNEAINDGYRKLYEELNAFDSDMVIGNMLKMTDSAANFNYYKTMVSFHGSEEIEKKDVKDYLVKTSFKAMSIQALIVKRKVVRENNLKMVESAIGQDTLFFYELLTHSNKTRVVDLDIHIYYADVGGSVTNVISKQFFSRYLLLEEERFQFFERNGLVKEYVEKRFATYFKNWYLKRLSKVRKEDIEDSVKLLYQIYQLYRPYIEIQDEDLALFERLYDNKEYERMALDFKTSDN